MPEPRAVAKAVGTINAVIPLHGATPPPERCLTTTSPVLSGKNASFPCVSKQWNSTRVSASPAAARSLAVAASSSSATTVSTCKPGEDVIR